MDFAFGAVRRITLATHSLQLGVAFESGPHQPNPTIKFVYVLDLNGFKVRFIENMERLRNHPPFADGMVAEAVCHSLFDWTRNRT